MLVDSNLRIFKKRKGIYMKHQKYIIKRILTLQSFINFFYHTDIGETIFPVHIKAGLEKMTRNSTNFSCLILIPVYPLIGTNQCYFLFIFRVLINLA